MHALATPDSSLVDVGCGVGNVLSHVREQVALNSLAGIEISKTCLSRTRETLECETYQGSILDDELVGRLGGHWNNIGPPVVSYYLNEQLKTMIEAAGCATITAHEVCQIELSRPWRLIGIQKRTDTTLVVQKDCTSPRR